MKALLGVAVLGMSLLAGTACGSPAPTCEPASTAMLDTIAKGAKADGFTVTSGVTLKSKDNLFAVAAKTKTGSGPQKVGVWSTSNVSGEGAVYAVDQIAKDSTSFGDAAQVDGAVKSGDAAAAAVKACL
ncbi:MAG TPA: hypothetical protein VGD11_13460 [Mycobacteriales bacterium]|jgi:hypothetical protein